MLKSLKIRFLKVRTFFLKGETKGETNKILNCSYRNLLDRSVSLSGQVFLFLSQTVQLYIICPLFLAELL